MSVIPVEKSFPRGGFQEFATHPRPSFQTPSLFRAKKPRHIPRNNFNNDTPDDAKNNKQQKSDHDFRLKKFTGQLTYKAVSEGMLSLGAIFLINDLEIKVTLPGNTIGTIPITNISETYTTALRNAMLNHTNETILSLRQMFKIGQHVVTRVVGKVLKNNRNVITLSIDPEIVYSDINLDDICKGSIVVASVKSIEDKGYVMAVGKSPIRAFLSHEESRNYEQAWNDDRKLCLGQIIRCYVLKATTLDSTTTLVLSANPAKVAKANYDKTGTTLEALMPGMKFTATVSNWFPSGIQIQLSENFVGYVYRDHFEAPFKTPENYEIGTSVKAQVLYILASGAVYFTLKTSVLEASPPTDPYTILKCGEIINDAKVFSTSDLGIIVKVGKHENSSLKGFVPLNQTARSSRHDYDEFDMPVSQQLAMEFPIQSEVTCRIMDYNYMDLYYVCTMDKELMNEKIINSALLEVGMVVPCTIKSIELRGIVLNIGKACRATGFVPLTQISDVLLSNPEKKFHVGQTCMARVLSLKDGKTIFTMKRLQVQSTDPILTSFEAAKVGDVYTGSVQQVNEHGLLIQFFNFVSGWLPTKYLGAGTVRTNITSKYDLGQLVPCKILTKDESQQKLVLALRDFEMPSKPKEKPKKEKEDEALLAWVVPDGKASSGMAPALSKRELKKRKKSEGVADTPDKNGPGAPKKKKKENPAESVGKTTVKTTDSTVLSKRAARRLRDEAKKANRLVEDKKNENVAEDTEQKDPPVLSNRAAKKLQAEARKAEWERNQSLGSSSELAKRPEKKKSIEKTQLETPPALSKRAAKKLNAEDRKAECEIKQSLGSSSESAKSPEKKKTVQKAQLQTPPVSSKTAANKSRDTALKPQQEQMYSVERSASGVICWPRSKEVMPELTSGLASPCKKQKVGAVKSGQEEVIPEVTSGLALLYRKKRSGTVQSGQEEAIPEVLTGLARLYKKQRSGTEQPVQEEVMPENLTGLGRLYKKQQGGTEQSGQETNGVVDASPASSKIAAKIFKPATLAAVEKKKAKIEEVELKLPALAVPGGFVWNATPNLLPVVASVQDEPESSADEEEEETTTTVKKTRQALQHERKIKAQQEEARLRKIEQRLMDEDSPPQSADEFDRLVLASPDSSIVWVQYMAYYLQAAEFDKAKNVGIRALKTISFREEAERLNVWGAMLNLENIYGTKDSLETTLAEAIKNNDAYEVHNRMLSIYADSSKFEEGDKLVAVMCKKFRQHKDMWYNAAVFYMRSSQQEKARALLARALTNLRQSEHVSTITKFALLENRLGSKERAQTLFEQVLTSYPKRIDVWGTYVDMLIKSNLIDLARQVLERAVCQRLPSHKMKTMFKKFLAFEEAYGTDEDTQKVRELALKYVESASRDPFA